MSDFDVLRHEFGHWVIARAKGFSVGDIEIRKDGAAAAVDLIPNIPDIAAGVQFIERRLIVLYAGATAEALTAQGINFDKCKKLFETTATNDHAKIRELMRILVGMRQPGAVTLSEFQKSLTKECLGIEREVSNLVISRREIITGLAKHFDNIYPKRIPRIITKGEIEKCMVDKKWSV